LSHTHKAPATRLWGPFHFFLLPFSRPPREPHICNFNPGPLRICFFVLLLSLLHSRNSQDMFPRFLAVPASQYFERSVRVSSTKASTSHPRALRSQLWVVTTHTPLSHCNSCKRHNSGIFSFFPPGSDGTDLVDAGQPFRLEHRLLGGKSLDQGIDEFQLSLLFLLARLLGVKVCLTLAHRLCVWLPFISALTTFPVLY
jgi:hypothetical protein